MFSREWTIAMLLALALPIGCVSGGRVDLLEARLREQQDHARQLQLQLESVEHELKLARREADLLQRQMASGGQRSLLPEQAGSLVRAEGIAFNSRLSGGLDRDGQPGDDVVNVLFAPHDHDGQLVKLPGDIEVAMFESAGDEVGRSLGKWQYPSEQSRDLWHAGFIGTGYKLELPWNAPPAGDSVLVHAKFTTPDGRTFESSQLVRVNPAANVSVTESRSPAGLPPDDPAYDLDPADDRAANEVPAVRRADYRRLPLDDRPRPTNPVITSDVWTEDEIPFRR